MSDEAASKIGAHVTGRRADQKKVDVRDLALSPLQARFHRTAAGFEGTTQVAVAQVSRCFLPALTGFNGEVPEIDIKIAEDLKGAG